MQKRIIKVFIERGRNGSYGAYHTAELPCGFFGEGATKQEAIDDYLSSHEAMKEFVEGKELEVMDSLNFEFHIDIKSYLEYYARFFTLKGLSEITGINQGQLSHYLNGYKVPRPATAQKIEDGLLKFAEDLEGLRLA